MDRIPPMSIDICVAHSQGGIGYLLMQAMESALREAGDPRHVAALLTQVEVDPDDPAFANPTKFVGPFFSDVEAARVNKDLGWLMREDSGRGWRHVVPSPDPKHICDISLVDELVKRGTVVIAGGGGGIPVVRRGDRLEGIEAVIDKDRTASLLARELAADLFLILTNVARVKRDFGTERERDLPVLGVEDALALLAEGQFPAGSMGPKIESAIDFVTATGRRVIITDIDHVQEAVDGAAGTAIVPSSELQTTEP
jgi:carbamate kinase